MRILFLSPRQCWPTLSGAKLREYHFLRALAGRAEVTYLHFTDPGAEPLTREDLPFCQEVVAIPKPPAYGPGKLVQGVLGRWPLPILNYTSQEMSAAVDRLTRANAYDLIHLDLIHMIRYGEAIARRAEGAARVVYNWHNIESELMRRFGATASSLGSVGMPALLLQSSRCSNRIFCRRPSGTSSAANASLRNCGISRHRLASR